MKYFCNKFFLAFLMILFSSSLAQSQRLEMHFEGNQNLKNATAAFKSGNIEKALIYYEKALERDNLTRSDKIKANNGLCAANMYLERYEEAITRCEVSLKLNPSKWETLNNLGISYLGLGDYKKAIFYLEKGLEFNGNSQILTANLDLAFQRQEMEKIRLEIEQEKNTPFGEDEHKS